MFALYIISKFKTFILNLFHISHYGTSLESSQSIYNGHMVECCSLPGGWKDFSPRNNGLRGEEEVGRMIGIEDGLFRMFNMSSGEEDLLLGELFTFRDWSLRDLWILDVW